MSEELTVFDIIPATPEEIYDAFTDPALHAKMTGGAATRADNDEFTAWSGYIGGRYLALDRPNRIVMDWRTSDFPDDADDSRVEIQLEPVDDDKSRMTIHHTNIPDGQGPDYEKGWSQFYFEPMKLFFA